MTKKQLALNIIETISLIIVLLYIGYIYNKLAYLFGFSCALAWYMITNIKSYTREDK